MFTHGPIEIEEGRPVANERRPCPEDNILVETSLVSSLLAPVHAYFVGVSIAGIGGAIFDRDPYWPRKGDVTW